MDVRLALYSTYRYTQESKDQHVIEKEHRNISDPLVPIRNEERERESLVYDSQGIQYIQRANCSLETDFRVHKLPLVDKSCMCTCIYVYAKILIYIYICSD